MIEKLLQMLSEWWGNLSPFHVVRVYNDAIVLRFGQYTKSIQGGALYFKVPLIDEIIEYTTVIQTLKLPSQTIKTKTNGNYVVKGVLKFFIKDVKPFLLELKDQEGVLSDVAMTSIRKCVSSLEDVEEIEKEILRICRTEMNRYGFKIVSFSFSDFANIKTIRLMHTNESEYDTEDQE